MKHGDVTIVGGSLAGSFAAYLLGQRGYRVLLVDPADRPAAKACGEGLSLIGKRYLEHSGLWNAALATRAKPYHGFDIRFARGSSIVLNSDMPAGYAVPRRLIDSVLRSAAENQPTVRTVRSEALCVEQHAGLWQVRCKDQVLSSRELIIANGLRGRKLVGASSSAVADRFGLVIRARGAWIESAPRHVLIENSPGVQLLLTPFDESRVNISILVTRKSRIEHEDQREVLIARALDLAHRAGLRDIVVEDCRGAARIGASLPVAPVERAYLVGDAAEVMDPIGGMGMSHALVSASLAAESIALALDDPERSELLWRKYSKRRSRIAVPLRLATGLSYGLNVSENRMIESIVRFFPRISHLLLTSIHRTIPVAGLVSNIPREKRSHNLRGWLRRLTTVASAALLTCLIMSRVASAEPSQSEWNLPRPLSDNNVRIGFVVDTTWHVVHGTTSGITGNAALAQQGDPSAITISIALPASRLDTGDSDRDDELRDVIASAAFPEISLSASSSLLSCTPRTVIENGQCADTLTADLTIRRTTKRLLIPITIRRRSEAFVISGSFDIRWADYEVEDPSIFLIAQVKPTVTIDFEVTLEGSR